jgi:thiol:disulfide interchange protein DsbD
MKKSFFLSCLWLVLGLTSAFAQIQDPVQFKTEWKAISDTEAQIVFTGVIDAGWHVYSTELPDGGPISATFNTDKMEGIELVGKLTPEGKEIEAYDKIFEMKLRYFEGKAVFTQKVKITAPTYLIEGYLEYGSCNDENCMPPTEVSFNYSGTANIAKKAEAKAPIAKKEEPKKEEQKAAEPAKTTEEPKETPLIPLEPATPVADAAVSSAVSIVSFAAGLSSPNVFNSSSDIKTPIIKIPFLFYYLVDYWCCYF